jgi:hypothetical protein
MSTSKYEKLRPSQIDVDPRWQRDLDETRARRMARNVNMARLGVPVVSRRNDGRCVALDGQHRIAMLKIANMDSPIMCDVQEGLSLADEAELYLLLNSDRKPVGAFDKFKARLVAKDAVALEIQDILKKRGLRVAKAQGSNCICAIQAVEFIHVHYQNLGDTLRVLISWCEGDPSVYEGMIIKDVSFFLAHHPQVSIERLAEKLQQFSPERLLARIRRTQGTLDDVPRGDAACKVLRDIYNKGARDKLSAPKAA